jgi:D-arabinonate dehydratase
MKIIDVRASRYVQDVDVSDFGRAADILVVEIVTDEDVVGLGITSLFVPHSGEVVDLYAKLITANFREILMGEEACATQRLWDKMYAESAVWGRTGIARQCMSVLDIALWDIKAKRARLPLWGLLGGPIVEKVPAYVNAALDLPPARLAERAAAYVAQGFTALKIRGSASVVTLDEATARVTAVREAVGPDVQLMVDVNGTWNADVAIHMLRDWEQFQVHWLEEPVPRDDVAGYVRVRRFAQQIGVNIAGGEQLESLREIETFIASGAVDIIQPCPTFVGGITEMIRIAHLAERFAIPVVPHSVQHVSLHLVASMPALRSVEVFPHDNPMREFALRIIEGPREAVDPVDGYLTLPTAPGIGYQLNHEYAAPFRVQ